MNVAETKEKKAQETAGMSQKAPLQDGGKLYNINPRLDTMNPLLGHSCTLDAGDQMLLSLWEYHLLDTPGVKTKFL